MLKKQILSVYLTDNSEVMFEFQPTAREQLERMGALGAIGDALAVFGEQLKMQGLGIVKRDSATDVPLLYGPNGRPV